MEYEARGYCGSPPPEIVAKGANAGSEHAARQRQPGAEDEDGQQGIVVHRR